MNQQNKVVVNEINPILGLMEFQNIVTVDAGEWSEMLIAAQAAVLEFQMEGLNNKNIVIVATDPIAANKIKKTFKDDNDIVVCNAKNDLTALMDLTSTYAVIVMDSSKFKDYTKYLFALKSRDDGSRLIFIY